MTDQHDSAARRSVPQLLSIILFTAALGFAAAAVYFWYNDDATTNGERPVPTVAAGMYTLINVLTAFEDAGLEANYGRSPATAHSNQIDPPGQNLEVGEANVFIFFFTGTSGDVAASARETALSGIDPATMTLETPSGNDVGNGQPLTSFGGANVIAVLIGGDEELRANVRDVIESLS